MSDEEQTKHRYLIRTERRNIYKIIEEKEEEVFNSCWIEYPKTEDGLIAIRKVLSHAGNKKGLDCEAAILQIATELGCEAIEPHHRRFIEDCIKVAIQRYIVENNSGILCIREYPIGNYTIEQLKDILLGLTKNEWMFEDELCLALGRYFGYRGGVRDFNIKKAIEVLVKEGSLKSEKRAKVYELGLEPIDKLIRLVADRIEKDPVLIYSYIYSYFKKKTFEDKVSWFKENVLEKIRELNQIYQLVPTDALKDPVDQGLVRYIQTQLNLRIHLATSGKGRSEIDE